MGRTMSHHRVKSWPDFFSPIASGERKFDLRRNDRRPIYAVGDTIEFREFDDRKRSYTGRCCIRTITSMIAGVGPGAIAPLQGLARDYVILSLAPHRGTEGEEPIARDSEHQPGL